MAWGYESRSDKKLYLDCWLTAKRGINGGKPGARLTAGYPDLARNERALNLKIGLPLALFETPSLTASINVDAPTQAVNIDVGAVAEAVRQVVGMDVDVQVAVPEQEG